MQLFETCSATKDRQFKVSMSFCRVGSGIVDLLAPGAVDNAICDSPSLHPVLSADAALSLLSQGRHALGHARQGVAGPRVGCHTVVSLHVQSYPSGTQRTARRRTAILRLVGLAAPQDGTASAGAVSAHGATSAAPTGRAVQTAIAQLELVMLSRARRQAFVPYRSSPLTAHLRDSLDGSADVAFLGTLRTEPRYYRQVASTLQFLQAAATLPTSAPAVEVESDAAKAARLERELGHVLRELEARDVLLGRQGVPYVPGSMPEEQRRDCRRHLQAYVDGTASSLPVTSLVQVGELFSQFRQMLHETQARVTESEAAVAKLTLDLQAAHTLAEQQAPPLPSGGQKQEREAAGGAKSPKKKAKAPKKGKAATAPPVSSPDVDTTPAPASSNSPDVPPIPNTADNDSAPERAALASTSLRAATGASGLRATVSALTEADAFAHYTAVEAAALAGRMAEAKESAADTRSLARELATSLNELKRDIDRRTASIEKRRRFFDDASGGAADVVDVDVHSDQVALRAVKRQYRAQHGKHAAATTELEATEHIIAETRKELLRGFSGWFLDLTGRRPNTDAQPLPARPSTANPPG